MSFTNHKSLKYVFTQKDLNLRQNICLKLLKDKGISVLYKLGKVNMVADDLSQLSVGSVASVEDGKNELVSDDHIFSILSVHLVNFSEGGVLVHNVSK